MQVIPRAMGVLALCVVLFPTPRDERSFMPYLVNANPTGGRLFMQGLVPGLDQVVTGWQVDGDYTATYDNMFRFKGRDEEANPYSSTHVFGLTVRHGIWTNWELGFNLRVHHDVASNFLSTGAEAVHLAMGQGFLNRTVYQAQVGGVNLLGSPETTSVVTFTPTLKRGFEFEHGRATAALVLRLPYSGKPYDRPGVSLAGTWSHWFDGGHFGILTAGAVNAQMLKAEDFSSTSAEISLNPVTWDLYLGLPMRFGWFWWSLGHRLSERRIWLTALPGQVLLAQITELAAGLGPAHGPWEFTVNFQEDVIGNYYNTDSDFSLNFRFTWSFPP